MLDELLLALKNVCVQLLPILGAAALIYLCILLKKAGRMIEQLTVTVKQLDPTIKLVDQSIEKVQAPLDTAVKLSHTVDQVHDKTVETVSKASEYFSENFDHIKDYVNEKVNEKTGSDADLKTGSVPQPDQPAEPNK